MRVESSVRIFKLRAIFRVVSEGFDVSNYIKRSEFSRFEQYKSSQNIVSNNKYPYLLVEFDGSDSKIRDIILGIKIQANSTDVLNFELKEPILPKNLILLSLESVEKLFINIEHVTFSIDQTQYKEVSTNAPIVFDQSYFHNFEKNELERNTYYSLSNYFHGSFYYRGILLKIAFNNLHDLEKNGYLVYNGKKVQYSEDSLGLVKSLIQIEIISKIMMYIEDLVALLESNRLNINYYELLDKSTKNDIDLGERIGNFFKSLDTFTSSDWKKILCYIQDNQNAYPKANELMNKSIERVKDFLKYMDSFSKSHSRIFRRYKHAGFPIRYFGKTDLSKYFPTPFDFSTAVYIGNDQLKDIVFLPYSNEIIESYKILLPALQLFLKDVLINRLDSMSRGVEGIIPRHLSVNPFDAKSYEHEYSSDLEKFELEYPKKFINVHFESVINDSYLKEMTWYTNLEENRKKWKENTKIEQNFKNEFD